ncbi:MAG TPA: hypothetical protein VGO03_11745 [Acidimicrobiia bacterium]|jgi:hypothetical protein
MNAVERIESASPLRRGIDVWYAVFGGVIMWTAHFMYLVCAEHWTHLHERWLWTLDAATVITGIGTIVAMLLSWRLVRAANGADPSGHDDAGQLTFLGEVGLLVGAINLALIALEGIYPHVIPHG